VGDIGFKMISLTEKIQINFKKPGFGRKNQLRMGKHLKNAYHSFNSSIYLGVQKIDTYIAKQCSHVVFLYFVMGLLK
jgi:hypothetical protein